MSEAVGYARTRSGQESKEVEQNSKPVKGGIENGQPRRLREVIEVDVGKLARSARFIEDVRCSEDCKVVARAAGWYRGY